MKKNISRNPLWPDWYNGKKIDEVQFGRAFLEQWSLKCVNGTLYTLDGPVEDESEIKQRILENIEEYVTSGLSKKVTNILETIKLLAFSDPFPIEQDCIHLQNGVYHLPDGTFQESRLFCQIVGASQMSVQQRNRKVSCLIDCYDSRISVFAFDKRCNSPHRNPAGPDET